MIAIIIAYTSHLPTKWDDNGAKKANFLTNEATLTASVLNLHKIFYQLRAQVTLIHFQQFLKIRVFQFLRIKCHVWIWCDLCHKKFKSKAANSTKKDAIYLQATLKLAWVVLLYGFRRQLWKEEQSPHCTLVCGLPNCLKTLNDPNFAVLKNTALYLYFFKSQSCSSILSLINFQA